MFHSKGDKLFQAFLSGRRDHGMHREFSRLPHLGDLASTEVGKTLERDCEYIGRPVDGEAFAGWHFLLAPAWRRNKVSSVYAFAHNMGSLLQRVNKRSHN